MLYLWSWRTNRRAKAECPPDRVPDHRDGMTNLVTFSLSRQRCSPLHSTYYLLNGAVVVPEFCKETLQNRKSDAPFEFLSFLMPMEVGKYLPTSRFLSFFEEEAKSTQGTSDPCRVTLCGGNVWQRQDRSSSPQLAPWRSGRTFGLATHGTAVSSKFE